MFLTIAFSSRKIGGNGKTIDLQIIQLICMIDIFFTYRIKLNHPNTVHIMFNCQNHSQLFGKNISCLGFWNCQEHLFASIPSLILVLWFSPWYIDHIGITAMTSVYIGMSDNFTPFSWFSFIFIRQFAKYLMELLQVKNSTKQSFDLSGNV